MNRDRFLEHGLLGADAGCDGGEFLRELIKGGFTLQVAMKRGRAKVKEEKGDARTREARRVGQVGYELSQLVRRTACRGQRGWWRDRERARRGSRRLAGPGVPSHGAGACQRCGGRA